MARGLLPISANFERRIAAPIDDMRVQLKSDLLLPASWTADDNVVYTWLGMFALVYGDTVNNGGYLLIASDYTLEASWLQIGSSVDLSDYVTSASLFRNGLIKSELLPDIASDVIELLELASILEDVVGMVAGDKAFYTDDNKIYTYSGTAWENPQTPLVNKLYLCKFDNLTYKWNGTTLVATTSPLPYATNLQAIAGTSFSKVLSPYANKYAFTTWIAPYALQSWVTENFALKESGIEPPLSETVQFITGTNTYTITDASAENITVQAIVAGSIDYGVLTADKAVKIINAGPAVITIDGTPVGAGVTAFAIFDFATADWTISTVIDPVIPDYSDIAVQQYTTTANVFSRPGYYRIENHGMGGTTLGNLIFVNNPESTGSIGVYQALEGGTGDIKAKKIVSGTKLNVIRVKLGTVYHSEYDGVNLASLKFSNITAKENVGVAAGLIAQIIDGATDDTLKKLQDKITALQAIVGSSDPDGDSVVNTVTELLAVFSAFPEGVDIATVLASKVNATDVYNALDAVVSGKVLDARQGKVLNDAIATLSSLVISDYQKKTDNSLETTAKQIAAAINEVNTKATASKTTVTYTAAFTLSANDKGKVIIVNSASDMAITIPANLTAGSFYEIWNKGAGIVSFVAGSGNVINSADSRLKIRGQYCGAYIYVETTNITQVSGDIVL